MSEINEINELCHKDTAEGNQSLLLGAFLAFQNISNDANTWKESTIGFRCTELCLYGIILLVSEQYVDVS